MKVKRAIVGLLSRLFPHKMSQFAFYKMSNPQVLKLRDHEIECLNRSEKKRIQYKDFFIQTYTWRGGPKSVLLIHGWEGQAGNFSDLVDVLIDNEYTVYAFDAPSHGFSSKQNTSIMDFTSCVADIIRKLEVDKLVSHSFGGVATTYALFQNQDIEIDKYVLLTTPDKFSERIDDVASHVGISEKVKRIMIDNIEKETGLIVNTLNVSNFVKEVKVNQALIIHDKNDKVIPITASKNVANNWKECEFKAIQGTGHFRILRTPEVLNNVLEFLDN